MASNNILFLFTLVSFLSLATTKAQDDDRSFIFQNCSSQKTNAKTSFYANLKTLLSSLSSNATRDSQFYKTNITHKNPSDSVYGMFMCRGDLHPRLCHHCVQSATNKLHSSSDCYLSKEAVIWYYGCMVRYSYHSFPSTMLTNPKHHMVKPAAVSNPQSFMRLLFFTMNLTADEASHHHNKYATKQTDVSNNSSQTQILYCLAQCTPDLSPNDCRTCLSEAIGELSSCCEGKIGGKVLYPSCNIRYELYPFYYFSMAPSLAFVPATNTSVEDSINSNDTYLSHNCSNDPGTFPNNHSQKDLETLVSYLPSNATRKSYHVASVANNVHGLFMCQPNLPSQRCGQCVQNATRRISSECYSLEAIIWYSHCMIHYSSRDVFSRVKTSPKFSMLNITRTMQDQNSFVPVLANTLDEAVIKAMGSEERYATKSSKLNDIQTLYALAQCTHDLNSDECWACFGYILGREIEWTRLGSVGGRVLYPSCNIRFELFNFYGEDDVSRSQATKSNFPVKIILIVVTLFVSVMVFSSGYYLLGRKARNSCKTIHR